MERTPLNHDWKCFEVEPESLDPAEIGPEAIDRFDWLPIALPGDVNRELVRSGRLPDPHFDTNGRRCAEVTAREWWLSRTFMREEIPAAAAELRLDGIDGHAEVFLNGTRLGRCENAFRPHAFAVADRLRPGLNHLVLRFLCIDRIMGGTRFDERLGGWQGQRARMRKPQFNFGWDWSLPLPGIGVMGDVAFISRPGERLENCSLRTFCNGRIDFGFEVTPTVKKAGYRVAVTVSGHGETLTARIDGDTFPGPRRATPSPDGLLRHHKSYCSLRLAHPRLWQPNGRGEAAQYDYRVELTVDGRVVDGRTGRLGLRETVVAEHPFTPEAGPGFSFTLEINGEPVFCQGANWIPTELWPANATAEQYRYYLGLVREAGFNMLRVWGGGRYEDELFYELCDEYGIMVWQDFMFASAWYDASRLQDEIIAETEYQLKRLSRHPCIVLWCGVNEDVFSWAHPADSPGREDVQEDSGNYCHLSWRDKVKFKRLHDDPIIYSMILRGLTGVHGQGVPYVESSPSSRDDAGNDPASGNAHLSCLKYLLGNDGELEFRRHFDAVCSFDSEFCIHGPCAARSLRTFMAPENHWPPNDAWTYHIQIGHRNLPYHRQIMTLAGGIFGPIDDLETYTRYGQALHAEMMRSEFECARRDRPNCGGTMFWMLNDCWPTSNWSVVDYYRRLKPAYYAARRACAPLLPIIAERDGAFEFFLSNQTRQAAETVFRLGQSKLDGSVRWERRVPVRAEADRCVRLLRLAATELEIIPGEYLFLAPVEPSDDLREAIYFPDAPRWQKIVWPDPALRLELSAAWRQGNDYEVTARLTATRFARFAHLRYDGDLPGLRFSDNFFDLPAATSRQIVVTAPCPPDPARFVIGHWGTAWE